MVNYLRLKKEWGNSKLKIKKQQPLTSLLTSLLTYESAETAIKGAPTIAIKQIEQPAVECIPQHFLKYHHHYDSVCQVVNDIEFNTKYPIFVSEQAGLTYMQIGIIGKNNYKHPEAANPNHIVYGRKWRIEPNLPSGEIVQTAFLALKKAKEHEVRELLHLNSPRYQKYSAPFSGHHDLALLAKLDIDSDASGELTETAIREVLSLLRFDWHGLELLKMIALPRGQVFIDLCFSSDDSRAPESIVFPELIGKPFSLIITSASTNELLHAIMRKLIELTDQLVNEQFLYRGKAIFSAQSDITKIADISIQMRDKQPLSCEQFQHAFKTTNFNVDASRVPKIKVNALKNMPCLNDLEGHLPQGMRPVRKASNQ